MYYIAYKTAFQIIAGTLNVYLRNPGVQMGQIKDVIPFTSPRPFDLAVVRLQKELTMVKGQVQPIKLVPQGFSPQGKLL